MRNQSPPLAPKLNRTFAGENRDYAVSIVSSVCCLAGDPEFLAHRATGGKKSLAAIIARHDTARLFDWLVDAFSYQGIAVATTFSGRCYAYSQHRHSAPKTYTHG